MNIRSLITYAHIVSNL